MTGQARHEIRCGRSGGGRTSRLSRGAGRVIIRAKRKQMRITIIDGHPDPAKERFCHAIASAYAAGAAQSGHEVRTVAIAELDVPFLRSQQEGTHTPLPAQFNSP
jgi:hypothetical protein